SSGNLGDLAGPLIAGALLGVMSWRWIMGGGTPFLLLLGVAVLVLLKHVGGPKPGPIHFGNKMKAQISSVREAFRGTGMWAIFTVSAVRGMGDRSYIFFLPFYLRQELEMGFFLVSVHVALVAAPGIVSGPLFGVLSDRMGRKSIIAFLMIVTVILSFTTVLAGGGIGMTVSVALFGLFHSSVNSLTQAAAIDEAEGKGLDATFMGLMWGSNAAFGAAAGAGVGVLVNSFGWEVAFYFAAAMFFLGFLATLAMPGKRARQPRSAQRFT
ncbi:MAG: MFS transporter, partial [Chloroflexi bacterium]|nr:MFS transporter [Chloroflexota bacterium]